MSDPTQRIQVEIFGASYSLRGGVDPAAVRALAQELDERMREIAGGSMNADPLKVAVLAALRLVEESHGTHDTRSDAERRTGKRIAALAERLDFAIAAAREDAAPSA